MIKKKFVSIILPFLIIIIMLLPVFKVSGINTNKNISNINFVNNTPPNAPEISGETNCIPGELYKYTVVSIDPDGDNVSYYIEFGTSDSVFTHGWFPSGEPIKINYRWIETGKFTIRAKAQDIYYEASDWGTLEVTITADDIAPEITIEKPENAFYIMGLRIRKFLSFRKPLIIGKINITVNAVDDLSGIDKIDFYIDDKFKASDNTFPYNFVWTWDKTTIFKHRHTIKAVAFDKEKNSATDEIIVWKFF